MSYDNTSFYGDLICDEYDERNNFMNPISPFGFFVYHILGDGFDLMSSQCEGWMNDFSILSASASGLDKFWGISYNMPRPRLPTSERLLTDDEYRIYLYLRNCRLLTREDIEINMNKCFALDDYGVYFSENTNYLAVTDYNSYEPVSSVSSNIHIRDDDDSDDYIISQGTSDDSVHLLEGNLSVASEVEQVVNIPFNDWDLEFLEFLEQYISVKGNLKLQEYTL